MRRANHSFRNALRLSAYLPLILFGAWGIYLAVTLPHWRDARYVRNPKRLFWGFWHFLDDNEWTAEGLQLRRRYFRGMGIALVVALVGIILGKILEGLGL